MEILLRYLVGLEFDLLLHDKRCLMLWIYICDLNSMTFMDVLNFFFLDSLDLYYNSSAHYHQVVVWLYRCSLNRNHSTFNPSPIKTIYILKTCFTTSYHGNLMPCTKFPRVSESSSVTDCCGVNS